jgi:hypothetical protein
MFVLGGAGDTVEEYTLTTPYSVSSAQHVDGLSITAKETTPRSMAWRSDGMSVYVGGSDSNDVHQYDLTAAWDISSATFEQTYDPSVAVSLTAFTFDTNGERMFTIDNNNIEQYDLGTAWDISTASAGTPTLAANVYDATPTDIYRDGPYLFLLGVGDYFVYRYTYGGPRDPLDYAVQPKRGTTQCGDDGSAQNPVAECGEQPPLQKSTDSAVCNAFLANEVWYLVNDVLTNEAPPDIPTDSSLWGPFWYVGGTPIGTELEVDEYDRQRFEKLCLKQGPTEDFIVTIIDIWQTNLISTWAYEDAGSSLDTGEWQFTTGTTTPVKIHDSDDDGTDQSATLTTVASGDKLRFVRDDNGTWIEYVTTGAASDQTTYWSIAINTTSTAQSSDWAGFPSAGGLMQVYLRESV